MSDNKITRYTPEPVAIMRAVVAAIPMVGGALDHLIFDKADAIRVKNFEASLAALSEKLSTIEERQINKAWFETEEALAVFRLLSEKTSYEPDKEKIKIMGRLAGVCGTNAHSADPNKLSVVEHLSRLSTIQIRLLNVISQVPVREKILSNGGLEQKATALWVSDIVTKLNAIQPFWTGSLQLMQELEVLESLNTIRRMSSFIGNEVGFTMTAIGLRASTYIASAEAP